MHLEGQIAHRDSNQDLRPEGSVAMLELPVWQQNHIMQMQHNWAARLQRIRECCLPQTHPGAGQ